MRKQRGMAMVLTLIILAGILAILAAVAQTQQVTFAAATHRMELKRAELVAQAGLQRALVELSTQSPNAVTQQDDWYVLGNNGDDAFHVGTDTFRLQILDASSRLNLNTAPEDVLRKMNLTEEQIASLLDWRSAGTTPRPDGAKDEYYNSLTYPYNAKLGNLDSLSELLLVKGFTPETLYEPLEASSRPVGSTASAQHGEYDQTLYSMCTVDSSSANVGSTGGQRQNINTATLQSMVQRGVSAQVAAAIITRRTQRGPFAKLGDVLLTPGLNTSNIAPIIDNYAVNNAQAVDGKLNLNTVTEDVLNQIPTLQSDMVSGIITKQAAGFTALSDLTTIPGFTLTALQQNIDYFTTGSRTFLVRVIGVAGSTSVPLEAIITLQNNTASISKTMQPPYNDMLTRWNWNTDTTSDVDLNGNQ